MKCFKMISCLLLTFLSLVRGMAQQPPALTDKDSWSIVLLPDPQGYAKFARNQPLLQLMTAWIKDNAAKLNTKLVLCTGDLVEQNFITKSDSINGDQESRSQWQSLSQSFATLDNCLPYVLCTGNHDYGTGHTENRYSQFNSYFPPVRNPLNAAMLVEMAPNGNGVKTLENACYEFTDPSGQKMLFLSLEFSPRKEVVQWAKQLCARPAYAGHRVLLLTHSYLYSMVKGNQRIVKENYPLKDATSGETLWQELIQSSPNIQMVVCGHTVDQASHQGHVGFRTDDNAIGLPVHQMLFNAQNEGGNWKGNGGDGWLRILEFLPDGKTVLVKTYSPLFGASPSTAHLAWRTEAFDQFSFQLTSAGKQVMKQQKPLHRFGLSNYKIPVGIRGATVGKIVGFNGQPGKAVLSADTSGLFHIVNNELRLQEDRVLSGSAANTYRLEIMLDNIRHSFVLVKDAFLVNKVVAHRGAWKYKPATENSLKALQYAIDMGCEGAEFDVWLSADSVPVINHDGVINGIKMEETGIAALQRIPLSNGDHVTTLAEYLQTGTAQCKTRLFLEIKSSALGQERTLALTEKVVTMVQSFNAQAWVTYISFNAGVLEKIKTLDPTAITAALWGEKTPAEAKSLLWSGLDYPYQHYAKHPGWIAEAQKLGLSVNVWTVDNPKQLSEMLDAGVDYITTNEPEMLLDTIHVRNLKAAALHGATIQIDPSFPYYKGRSNESIVNEIELAGYKAVHYFVVNENQVNGALINAFHKRGIAVWLMVVGNGTYDLKGLPDGWQDWKMEMISQPNGGGFTFFSLFSREFTQWRKKRLSQLVTQYAFDGIELAETYFPEWDAFKTGRYGDVGHNAVNAFTEQFKIEAPEFRDTASLKYYRKDTARFQQWSRFRNAAVGEFLNEVINGREGIRQARPDLLVATWSLAVSGEGDMSARIKEDHGLDAVAIIEKVKPDVHFFQTHWPDWGKTEAALPPDYMKFYQSFVHPVQQRFPGLPLGIQADQGSARNMIKSAEWLSAFHKAFPVHGYATSTTYEYHLGGYIYHSKPKLQELHWINDTALCISFNKRIDSAAAARITNYNLLGVSQKGNEIRAAAPDGNQVVLYLNRRLKGKYFLSVSGITDTPELWLYKGFPANKMEEAKMPLP